MLVVKIELWSADIPGLKKEIGRTYIWNDGSGDLGRGNYGGYVCRKGNFNLEGKNSKLRELSVQNYPRLSYNVWRLVLRALRSAFPEEK